MTTLTPEQMRALAEDMHGYRTPVDTIVAAQSALRSAADQLEALQRLSDSWKREGVTPDFWIELNRALRTGGTAPQDAP